MKYVLLFFISIQPFLAPSLQNHTYPPHKERKCLKIERELLKTVKDWEGFRSKRYFCQNGYETIGYGCLTQYCGKLPETITEAQGDSLLKSRWEAYKKEAKVYFPELTGIRLLVATDILFNLGAKKARKLIRGGELDTVRLMKQRYKKRREEELRLWKECEF